MRVDAEKHYSEWTWTIAIAVDSYREFCRHRCRRAVCAVIAALASITVPFVATDVPVFSNEVWEKEPFIHVSVRSNRISFRSLQNNFYFSLHSLLNLQPAKESVLSIKRDEIGVHIVVCNDVSPLKWMLQVRVKIRFVDLWSKKSI